MSVEPSLTKLLVSTSIMNAGWIDDPGGVCTLFHSVTCSAPRHMNDPSLPNQP